MEKAFFLENRAVLKITGNDSKAFLQGLITNDINKVAENSLLYAMMLTPQGRFLYDFFIQRGMEGFYLEVPFISKGEIIKKLNMYKLRADVVIQDVSDEFKVYCSFKKDYELSLTDPRDGNLGYRFISMYKLPCEEHNTAYELKRIKLKIPDAEKDFIYEKSFPLEYGAVKLNAVDFNKGCYVGQEVTARTYNRGVIRKNLFILQSMADNAPLKGEEIYCDGKKIGLSLGFCGNIGLGLLNIEEANQHKNVVLIANSVMLKILE